MATRRSGEQGAGRSEIVVFRLVSDSRCDDCGEELGKGRILVRRDEQGFCLACADLDDLVYLPRGNAALTRRAGKTSRARVVVVRWSHTRKRYERQGLLVEEAALERAEVECLADADARARARERADDRRARVDEEYARRFADRIRELYPRCEAREAEAIAAWTCRKHTGRIGRSAAAKSLEEDAVHLAVRAHVRHVHTGYDELLFEGVDRVEARERVAADVERVLADWATKG